MPSINSSRQPGSESSATTQSSKNNRASANNRSAKNRSRSANSSDSENASQKSNMPPDPASSRGEPEDEIDFSEDKQASQASSSRAAEENGSPSGGGSAPNESPTSATERIAELDRQFESTMGDYDGMILREREFVRNRSTSAESQADTGEEAVTNESLEDLIQSAEAELPGGPPGSEAGGGPQENNSSGQNTGLGLPTKGRKGEYDHTGTASVVPANIPDGNDDDVVARQIREAATRETDPELQEKLWEEYRKYKKVQK